MLRPKPRPLRAPRHARDAIEAGRTGGQGLARDARARRLRTSRRARPSATIAAEIRTGAGTPCGRARCRAGSPGPRRSGPGRRARRAGHPARSESRPCGRARPSAAERRRLDQVWMSYGSRSGRSSPASIRLRSSTARTRWSRRAPPRRSPARRPSRTLGQWDGRIDQIAGSRPDAGERRPQVMRHRVEQGGLERVALSGDLGARSPPGEAIASQATGRSGRRQGQDLVSARVRHPLERSRSAPMLPRTPIDRSDRRPTVSIRTEDLSATGRSAPSAAGLVRANPASGFVTGRPDEGA